MNSVNIIFICFIPLVESSSVSAVLGARYRWLMLLSDIMPCCC